MAKTSDKYTQYINKIENDPQKLKELRKKAAKRMKKRRSALANKKNQTVLKHIQEKERKRIKDYREKFSFKKKRKKKKNRKSIIVSKLWERH